MKPLQCVFLICLMTLTAFCQSDDLSQQRAVYQQALLAIQENDEASYLSARQLLKTYPLLPYLEYEYLSRRFDEYPSDKISRFLARYPDTFIAQRMYVRWLNHLGAEQQWALFDRFYQAEKTNDGHQCYLMERRLAQTEQSQVILSQFSLFWLKPYSLPSECDRLLARWQQAGFLNNDLAWQRFQASFADNNLSLARYLVRYLKGEQQVLADQLLNIQRDSAIWLARLQQDNINLNSAVLNRLLRQLSRNGHHLIVADIVRHKAHWFTADDLVELQQVSAWHLARISGDVANHWLTQVDAGHQPRLTETQLRYAMQEKNWLLYQKLFNRHHDQVANNDEWLYWYAIAQKHTELLDSNEWYTPDVIMKRLASRRSFYGFLAAELQQTPISLQSEAPKVSAEDLAVMQKKLAISTELYAINELAMANREWFYITRHFTESQWQQAGLVAHAIQWHDKTIQAFAKAKQWHAIDERFPLAWQELFFQHAQKNAIEQSWLLAMARQESGFSPRAQSPVGALGVLQLMPDTAKQVAKRLDTRYDASRLFEPDYNISLGSRYLKEMLSRFDNNYILATAAYNAGPHRVNAWLKERPLTKDWVHWVATIPFPETRDYVKNILTYSRIYQVRLGQQDGQLSLLSKAPKT